MLPILFVRSQPEGVREPLRRRRASALGDDLARVVPGVGDLFDVPANFRLPRGEPVRQIDADPHVEQVGRAELLERLARNGLPDAQLLGDL